MSVNGFCYLFIDENFILITSRFAVIFLKVEENHLNINTSIEKVFPEICRVKSKQNKFFKSSIVYFPYKWCQIYLFI